MSKYIRQYSILKMLVNLQSCHLSTLIITHLKRRSDVDMIYI